MAHASGVQMHATQLAVTQEMVRELVDDEFPEWRTLAITGIASVGTVNAIFRVGDQLAARLPLQSADVDSTRRGLEAEARAARELLGRTRFATPEVVALGEPGAGYPLPWSVQTWLPGVVATDDDPADPGAWRSASSAASSSWTFHGFAGCGASCGRCLEKRLTR